jgi:subtilase family serine protease
MTRQRRSNRKTVAAALSAAPRITTRVVMAEVLETRRLLSAIPNPSAFALNELAYPQGDGPPSSDATASPQGYSPTQIKDAYGISNISFGSVTGNGAGQTIAIVDAYNNPNLVDSTSSSFDTSDLHMFDAAMGLPDPPSFTKINQTGGTSYPATDDGWANEAALDVEWTHAIAPDANIVLVEANSTQLSDLLDGAAAYAATMPGVSVVTMSFADTEFYGEDAYDPDLVTPSGHQGVTFVAASGDDGGVVDYPAASPNVVSVGATTLDISSDSYQSESALNTSGGGISAYESKPSYQFGVTKSSEYRTVPDVAVNGNKNTGVSVYDSLNGGSGTPWFKIGGTSASAPLVAAEIAIANQGRASENLGTLNGLTQTLPRLYSLNSADFHDITTGSNGYSAGTGYDLATGLGSPIANKLVPDLAGGAKVTGTVFSDPNGTGAYNSNDTGLSGYTVYIDLYGTGVLEGADPSAVSSSTGAFTLTDLPGGTFSLTQTTPAGVDLTTPHDQSITLNYDATVTGKNIGFKPTGQASHLAFAQQPTAVIVGDVITPAITVDVEDASGGIVTADNSLVTLSVASGGGSVGGTLSVDAVAGVATFSDITISSTGTESIKATDGSLTSATSSTFTVSPVPPVIGNPAKLAFSQQPFPVTAGSFISPAITVQVQDSNGNLVTSDTSKVTLGIASGPAGGVLGGTLTVSAVGGIATFSNVALGVAGTYTLTASDGSLTTATSSSFVVSPIVYIPAKLVVAQQPSAAYVGASIGPAIAINVEDANGVLVTTDDSAVTLTIASGPTGAKLGGTLSVYAVNGVATFSDITVSEVGTYTLTATDGVLDPATTNSFGATIEGTIAPSIIASTVPAAAVGGSKIHGSVVVNETNLATATATGTVITSIYASDNGSLVLLGTVGKKMKVVVKKTYLITVPIKAIPATLSGNYSLVATVTDPTGNAATSLAGASLKVSAPFIAITPAITKMTLAAAVVSGSKSTASVSLSLTNNGNVTATGNTRIGIYASPDGSAADATLITTVTRRLSVAVGRSTSLTVPLGQLPAGLDGNYKILAQVADPDSNITSAATSSTVKFAPAFVAFTLSAITASPASVTVGEPVTMTITIQNTGNIAATGPATIQLGVSSDGISQLYQLTTITRSQTIASGKELVLHLKFEFYVAVTPGMYYPFVTYTQDGVTASAAGADNFTITPV